jgi:integrase/recombinase XerC/integrase/recombinase XerD
VKNELTVDRGYEDRLATINQLTNLSDLTGYLNAFLLSCRVDRLSPATLRYYRQKIEPFARFCHSCGIWQPEHVTASHVRAFLLQLQETNNAVSVADFYRALKRWFNWMIAEEMITKSPMATIRPPRVPKKIVHPLSPQHIKDALAVCDNGTFVGMRDKAIILLLLDTGLRLSEAANIKLGDIDIEREIIRVQGKGARERIVRVGTTAQKALLRYLLSRKDKEPWLWVTQSGTRLKVAAIAQRFRVIRQLAGITDVRCSAHTCRHTFATSALLNGAGEFEVQSVLGHSTLHMTRLYVASLTSEQAILGHKRWSPVDSLKLR